MRPSGGVMTGSTRQFYDALSTNYHLIFADWHASVERQGGHLDRLLRRHLSETRRTLLDCACGIGTQACGLALNGWQVHGTDLSPAAVEQARQNARSFGIEMTFGVADFRTLTQQVAGTFDAVICCDNSIAHVHSEDDLVLAFRNMAAKVVPDGVLLISLRDYDRTVQEKPRSTLPIVGDREFGRSIVFQVWNWAEDFKSYQVQHFTLKQHGDAWETDCVTSHLQAWLRTEVMEALEQARLTDITWHMPEDTGHYQPIVTARRP
jgi:glycine/sarcosine N-methyltransferase